MNLNKKIIALTLVSVLGACSDSSTVDPVDPVLPPLPPLVSETEVDGRAIKGLLTNATVSVYKFVGGEPVALTDTELKDANISTDEEGNYTFTLLDYSGPIKIELSPSTDTATPTTMTCDAPDGCGGTAFGAQIDLTVTDPSFKLNAISMVTDGSSDEVKVNVSALTHLAAELIQANAGDITAETVTEKSVLIASTFGIDGDITLLEPTVTDDTSAIAAEDNLAELKYGLINAGIMSALFSGENDNASVLSSKLAEVVADIIEHNGEFLVTQDDDDSFELALAEVLEAAAKVAETAADAIATDDTITSTLSLAQIETQLINEKVYQEVNVGADGRANVVVDVPTDGDAVTKAKAMVEDVRLLSHLFDQQTDHGNGITSQGDEYVSLLDDAGTMIQSEVKNFELLTDITNALAELSLQHEQGTLTPEALAIGVSITDYLTVSGASGTVTFNNNTETQGILFKVEASSGNENASLTASAEFSEDKRSLILTINGLLESAGAKFILNEGSFVKVTLDNAITRDELETGTVDADIVSGELDLAISLAQKESELVPNPVTFTGQIKTKLLIVQKPVLAQDYTWDEENQTQLLTYGRSKLESFVLPETLTLSGEFSAHEGDLIGATLTVKTDNLDAYEAPELKYIGKEVADLVNFTFSEDLNTIIIADSNQVSDNQQRTETRVFTPGSEVGEWTATSSVATANSEKHPWGTGIERKIITKRFDSGLSEKGIIYTRAFVTGALENNFNAKSVRITPVDHNSDGATDAYSFELTSTSWDSRNYDGTSVNTLIDSNGNVLTSDGNIRGWDNAWQPGEFLTIEAFMRHNQYNLIANPLTVTNGSELLAQTLTNWWKNKRDITIDDVGIATVFFNEEELTDIAAGQFTELNPTAYLTQPSIKDALTVTVSEDANTVDISFADAFTGTRTFENNGAGSFYASTTTTHVDGATDNDFDKVIMTPVANIDADEVLVSRAGTWLYNQWAIQIKITPQDNNSDGVADSYYTYVVWGDNFNDDGELIDYEGKKLTFADDGYSLGEYSSLNDLIAEYSHTLPYNPYTVNNGLDFYKAKIMNTWESKLTHWVDGIGEVEIKLSEEELSSIIANSTTSFDGINTEADTGNLFEDKNTFVDFSAALTLEAILGDYQVKLQLAGERTGLESGAFALDMSYRLPSADIQRSFTAHYNTEVDGRLTANNADGVVLVLNEPDEDATGTQVLGQILVGPTAIIAATIEDRNGLIMIVYSDETTESL